MGFVYFGTFNYTGSQGIHICNFEPESGSISYIKTVFPEVNTNCVNVVGNVLYATDEKAGDPEGDPHSGGRVYAFSIDPVTGDLTMISKKRTFGVNPSYLSLDATGKYALVPHFAVGDVIIKAVQDENGEFSVKQEGNDGITCLFRVEEDGSLGKLCDVFHHTQGAPVSMIHKTYQMPGKNIYAENDLAGDMFYFLQIDYENCRKNLPFPVPALVLDVV